MFNLEQAVADWRRRMQSAGVKAPAPLDELETHLRDEVERRMRDGGSAPQAFAAGVRQIGEGRALQLEFKKVNMKTSTKQVLRIITILAALFGTVLGGGLILPALAKWKNRGEIDAGLILAGVLIAVTAGAIVIYGVRTNQGQKGRTLLSVFTIVAGWFYLTPLLQAFFRPGIGISTWLFCVGLAAAAIVFYGSCLYLLRRSTPSPPIGN